MIIYIVTEEVEFSMYQVETAFRGVFTSGFDAYQSMIDGYNSSHGNLIPGEKDIPWAWELTAYDLLASGELVEIKRD